MNNALRIPGADGKKVNVGAPERLLSVFAGGILTSIALRNRNWTAAALATGGGVLLWRGISGHCPAYNAAGVNTAESEQKHQHTEQVVTIDAPAEKLYAFWRDFTNLPGFMEHLKSVEVLDNNRSKWTAVGIGGKDVTWTASIVDEVPNERIRWRSEPGAAVPNEGVVEFSRATGGRGTVVRVLVDYQMPGGDVGLGIAKLMYQSPGMRIREDLRRFKQLMEAGEIPTTKGQPAAHRHSMFAAFSESSK